MSKFSTRKQGSNQNLDKAVRSEFVSDALKVLPQVLSEESENSEEALSTAVEEMISPLEEMNSAFEDLNDLDSWYLSYSPSATPRRGSKLRGTVVDERKDCFWVDYGGKSEAMAMKSQYGNEKLKIGETSLFLVVRSEDDDDDKFSSRSCVQLSREGAHDWEELEEARTLGNSVHVNVISVTRNERRVTALKVRYKKIQGIIPYSLLGLPASSVDALRHQSIEVLVHEVIPESNRLVFDRKSICDEILQKREELIKSFTPGQIFRQVPVVRVVTGANGDEVGILVKIDETRGLVHRSELRREQLRNSIKESFKPGDLVDVMLLPCRKSSSGRSEISLSIRALQALKKKEFFETHELGQIVLATPQRKAHYGIFASIDLDADLDGLLHYSQCSADGEPEIGKAVEMKIIALDSATGRVGLSMQDLG